MILAGLVWSGLCSTPSCLLGACRRLWGSALRVYSKSCYIFFLVPHHACLWQKNFHFLSILFNICYDLPLDGTLVVSCLWWTTNSNILLKKWLSWVYYLNGNCHNPRLSGPRGVPELCRDAYTTVLSILPSVWGKQASGKPSHLIKKVDSLVASNSCYRNWRSKSP
jgi:hypothetical protein